MSNFLIQTNIPIFHYSLAQTWHAGPEFHGHYFGNPTATERFSTQLAPGQAIIPFGLHETCSNRNAAISISCRISETFELKLPDVPILFLNCTGNFLYCTQPGHTQ